MSLRNQKSNSISNFAARTPRLQGLYYVATGLWPLVSMRSFEAVTGPKRDRWLVKTVGSLVTVIGATLVVSSRRSRPTAESATLGILSALALIGVDSIFTAEGRIPPIYLGDAAVEAAILAGWIFAPKRTARRHTNSQIEATGGSATNSQIDTQIGVASNSQSLLT